MLCHFFVPIIFKSLLRESDVWFVTPLCRFFFMSLLFYVTPSMCHSFIVSLLIYVIPSICHFFVTSALCHSFVMSRILSIHSLCHLQYGVYVTSSLCHFFWYTPFWESFDQLLLFSFSCKRKISHVNRGKEDKIEEIFE